MTTPNLFLIAAPRSGSTQLARWLSTHPDIALPLVKEPNHFSAHEFPADYVARSHLNDVDPTRPPRRPAQFAIYRNREDYLALYAGMTERYRLDASTSYFACPEASEAIAAAFPDAKIIALSREPVARALSHYALARRTGRTRETLSAELEREARNVDPPGARYLIRPSILAPALERIRGAFAEHQVFFLRFEDMIHDPQGTLQRIAAFLDLSADFDLAATARNGAAAPRLPFLNSALQHTGLKTALRRATPTSLRPILRAIWFREGRTPPISDAELATLREALKQ